MNSLFLIVGMALGWFLKWTVWDSGMAYEAWRFCVSKDARKIHKD
jgi:hypothetical protein